MRRFLGPFILLFAFLAKTSIAQQGGARPPDMGPRPHVGSDAAIVDLLQQSHDLDRPLPLQEQVFLLRMQAGMVAEFRPDLGREWANELFLGPRRRRESNVPRYRTTL